MLASECGYTPKEIGAMTLHDAKRIFDHWKRFPPLRTLVAACARSLGYELPDPNAPPVKPTTAEEFDRVVAQFGSVPRR